MGEWKDYQLSDIAEIVGGGTPKTKVQEYWNGEIPWLTPRDLSNFSGRYISNGDRNISESGLNSSSAKILPQGTVLLSSRAPVGYLAIALNEITTNQGFRSLIPNAKSDGLFLFYLLKNNVEYLKSQSTGTTFGELAGSTLKSLSFLFPPLPEQKAIASVLSSLDDKIDLLHRQNKTLEAMAETLFRQWFVEEAKEEWEEGVLPDEFDFTMGQSPPGSSYNQEGIGMPMFQGNADFGSRFPTERVYTTEPKRLAYPLDTLISVRAPVGAQNMAQKKCCIGRGVAAFRYTKDNKYYTYTYFKLRSLMDEIKKFNDEGTVFGSIGKTDFQQMETVLPPEDLIENFESEAKVLNDKVIENCNQIKLLEAMRDTLLPKLMSGEVRIKNFDNFDGAIN